MFDALPVETSSWRASLNPAQLEAVTAGPGPILVIAGAGSGKTWTLACRVAHLIEQGVQPERILLLTFSRRAAREMLSRADRLVGQGRAHRVWGGTFHAVANRWLRLFGRPLGLAPDFTVLDQADSADLMDLVRSDLQLGRGPRERRFPKKDTLAAIYSRMVNAGIGLSSILESAYPWCTDDVDDIRRLFADFTQRKRALNLLDYDDLLLFWRAVAESSVGRQAAREFEHILVDEYQDTNPLQAEILLALRRDTRNLMVVGDDAQAIYSFRSASVRNILDFPEHFSGARRITLEQNYRSTRPILEASNAVIALARERFPKELWAVRPGGARPRLVTCADEPEQAVQVCRNVLEHREQGTELKRQVVLFRTSHHSDLLELELTRRNIPFVKYGGLKFLEAAHIKDTLAALRVLENPRDEVSWFRLLQLIDGIGPATARSIMSTIGVRSAAASPLQGFLAATRSPSQAPRSDVGPPPPSTATGSARSSDAGSALSTAAAGSAPSSAAGSASSSAADSALMSAAGSVSSIAVGPALSTAADSVPSTIAGSIPAVAAAGSASSSAAGSALVSAAGSVSSIAAGPALSIAADSVPSTATDSARSNAAGPDPSIAAGPMPSKLAGSELSRAAGSGPATAPLLDDLRSVFADCLSATLSPGAEVARIRRFLEPIFERRYSSAAARLQDIDQLERVAGGYTSRGAFLSELALDPPTSTSDLAGPPLLDEDYLILSTVHSAKGGEWGVVHVIHAADGMIPSDMSTSDAESIEEERRLFYVALTRARDMLYVYFPLRFYRRPRGQDDAHHYAQLTRFLPSSVQPLFDHDAAPHTFGLPEPEAAGAANGRTQVDTLLASLWDR